MADASERLLLMEEEWMACMKVKKKGRSSGGSGNRSRR
jgi:hypothetical protein